MIVACEEGDWLGPVERGLRALVNGWDMWATDAVRPYEDPMPELVPGTVPTEDRFSFQVGQQHLKEIKANDLPSRALTAYRRYCHHCHGKNGDGRIIVGESHEFKPPDLRSPDIQSKTDRELFEHVKTGGDLMLPLAATLSPLDILLTAHHIRTLKDRPSKPYYPVRDAKPIR